jgi:diacylglycerol kinase
MGVDVSPGPDARHDVLPDGQQWATEESAAQESADDQAAAVLTAIPWLDRGDLRESFAHAWDGLRYAVRTQRNVRLHMAAAAGALVLGLLLQLSLLEFVLVLLTIVTVLAAELFNTVVESLVDLVTDEYHELARTAKDVAAGAVLLCAFCAVVIGTSIYLPHVWALLLNLLGN